MNDSIETLELENKMLRARNERLTKEALSTKCVAQPEQASPMSEPNRAIAYAASSKLHELGYRYLDGKWMQTKEPEQEPVAYPEGDVVGPCICGSWPGGKCLKCPRITTPPQRKPLTDEVVSRLAHNIDHGDWNDLNFKECWHEGFKAGFREAEIEHNIKGRT